MFIKLVGTVFIATALTAFVFIPSSPVSAAPPIPCSDVRGCPDFQMDSVENGGWQPVQSTETFTANDCAVEEGAVVAGTRTLLRFNTLQANRGAGQLDLGAPSDHPDYFAFDLCHGHYHFLDSAAYRIWTRRGYAKWTALKAANPDVDSETLLATHPNIDGKLKRGAKRGFCLEETFLYPTYDLDYVDPVYGQYFYHSCDYQGLNPGSADGYWASLDGQWVDVTGLAAGTYVLEQETNPHRTFEESNYANNSASQLVTIVASNGSNGKKLPNDNFSHGKKVTLGASLSGSTAAATLEAGEPQSACGSWNNGASAWYKFTGTGATVTADTIGGAFDTVLSINTGTALTNLTEVTCNDDGGTDPANDYSSQVSWPTIAGTVYYIQLTGYNGSSGNFQFHLN